jgi:hypothetical protein
MDIVGGRFCKPINFFLQTNFIIYCNYPAIYSKRTISACVIWMANEPVIPSKTFSACELRRTDEPIFFNGRSIYYWRDKPSSVNGRERADRENPDCDWCRGLAKKETWGRGVKSNYQHLPALSVQFPVPCDWFSQIELPILSVCYRSLTEAPKKQLPALTGTFRLITSALRLV